MSTEDFQCTKYCNRKEHGDFIISALTKRAVSDVDLSAFLNYTCILCGSSKDVYGRTALHMAASCGRTNVCKWLVCQKQAKIDDKDVESGYTALHRCIFYGKIDTAIALIQLGGNLKILDSNDLTPLDHAMQDNLKPFGDLHSPFIYVWGSNTNYTLGPNQSRHHPEILDSFHKPFPHLEAKQIYLEKFHTVILTSAGDVFTFGMGQGGRLGIGTEKAVLEPTEVKFVAGNGAIVKISHCSIARDHCLFLTDTQEVWSCGLNTHHVLGVTPPPTQLLTPRPIHKLKSIEGIACGRYHSIAWNSHALYTWGFNGGQLGHDKTTDTITHPKLVTCISSQNRKIISAAASNGATAIATDKGDVYILHEFQCRTIASKNLGIATVSIYGGKLSTIDEKREDLKVLALTKTGNILIWQETDPHLCRCTFSLNRLLKIKQFCLNAYGLVFITEDREVFNGKFKARKRKTTSQSNKKNFNNFLERNDCVTVQVEKVSRLYGANSIACDLEGHNFAALHLNTSLMITLIPEISQSTISQDFERLMEAIEIEPDIMYKVGSRIFPAHTFIIRASSEKLSKLNDNGEYVVITNVEPEIFQEIIIYIYIGTCSLLKEGDIPHHLAKFNRNSKKLIDNTIKCSNNKSRKNVSAFEVYQQQGNQDNKLNRDSESINDPIRLLQEAAKKLGINALYKDLNQFAISAGKIKLKSDKCYRPRLLSYKQSDFPELHDVRIKGTCGKFVEAHKCILAARSEFFTNMFSMRWMQQNDKKAEIVLPATIECVQYLIDYLYMDQVDLDHEDAEQILNLLILADHILLDRLVEICEFALSKLVTIKNVLKLLTLSDIYNTDQLKGTCMEFACLNLALLLETRHLEQLDDDLLQELTKFYGNWNAKMLHRVITPFSDATSDEVIRDVSVKYPVKMDFNEIIKAQPQRAHRKRNRTHRTSASDNRTNDNVKEKENIPLEIHRVSTDVKVDIELERLGNQMAKSAPVRIQAISKAHERINDILDDIDFVNLSLVSEKDFPDLNMSFGSPDGGGYQKTTPKQKGKMTRLSQKERKRLSSECSVKEVVVPESPKNPWNMNFETSSPVGPSTFGNIITEEKKQRENLSRIKSKLLIYTQLEDKALEDLEKFYNVGNVFDEIIQVRRVDCGQIAVPLWIQK